MTDIPKGVGFTRYKGLGEMDVDEIYQACMHKPTQNLLKVDFPTNIDDFNEAMTSAKSRFDILDSMGVIKRVNA